MGSHFGNSNDSWWPVVVAIAVIGWAVIELLIWLFSFISITVNF